MSVESLQEKRGGAHGAFTGATPTSSDPSVRPPAEGGGGAPPVQRAAAAVPPEVFSHYAEPVQRRGGSDDGAGRVQRLAALGLQGAGGPLPYLDQIQRSFGRHDVSQVQAHSGGPADAATGQMGAAAYATGNNVVLGRGKDLHTVAHEAAHTVQQRAGVQLQGGVGRVGDEYERHADAVADRVVQGRSAEDLLDRYGGAAPGQGGGSGVQQKKKKKELPSGEEGFDKMWEEHPHHNGAEDKKSGIGAGEDISDKDLCDEEGLPTYNHTCALRMSVMLNNLGLPITKKRVQKAGIDPKRLARSEETGFYYLLMASDMWTYLTKQFRPPDAEFPASGRYKNKKAFKKAFQSEIREVISSKKGIVAFDKIFTFSGSGHVDIFDGMNLSDSRKWYSCEHFKVWFIA